MSLCIAFFQKNKIFVSADSRVSCSRNHKDEHYLVSDNFQKVRQFGNKVIFAAGYLAVCQRFFSSLTSKDSINSIQNKAKNVFNLIKKYDHNEDIEFGVYIFTIENEIAAMYQITSQDDFKIHGEEKTGQSISTVGCHSEEAKQYILGIYGKETSKDMTDAIREAFEYVSDEMVGGYMHSYAIISPQIINYSKFKIINGKKHREYNNTVNKYYFHADLNGNLFANNATVRGNMDCLSLKINSTNILDEVNKIKGVPR